MTTLETREKTRSLAGEMFEGLSRAGQGGARGFGVVIGRSFASRLGRRDGVARVADFLCEDACAVISGRVWAVIGGREM